MARYLAESARRHGFSPLLTNGTSAIVENPGPAARADLLVVEDLVGATCAELCAELVHVLMLVRPAAPTLITSQALPRIECTCGGCDWLWEWFQRRAHHIRLPAYQGVDSKVLAKVLESRPPAVV